jgi:ribosomal protein L29
VEFSDAMKLKEATTAYRITLQKTNEQLEHQLSAARAEIADLRAKKFIFRIYT